LIPFCRADRERDRRHVRSYPWLRCRQRKLEYRQPAKIESNVLRVSINVVVAAVTAIGVANRCPPGMTAVNTGATSPASAEARPRLRTRTRRSPPGAAPQQAQNE